MQFTLVPALLAAGAVAMPSALKTEKRSWTGSESGLTVNNVGYQGDGVYVAAFGEDKVATVQFTPLSELNQTAAVDLQGRSVAPRGDLSKRGLSCSNSQGNVADMDRANVQLANNAQAHGIHNAPHWGWAIVGNELSFYCVYAGNQYLSYQQIIDRHIWISDHCGGSHKYGYDRCGSACGFIDTAVGRTFKGDHICDGSFRPS